MANDRTASWRSRTTGCPGIGEATVDSSRSACCSYSGARTTYKVDVTRLAEPPDVQAIGQQFAAVETKNGGFNQLSVRDTARATIGAATFAVDYARPLVRGRELLGELLPYDYVWRTGANAATQFTTSAPITLAGIRVPAGTYTLWTVPRRNRADIIVNAQSGQWGTEYDGKRDVGMAPMKTDSLATPVEKFTISIAGDGCPPRDAGNGVGRVSVDGADRGARLRRRAHGRRRAERWSVGAAAGCWPGDGCHRASN